MRGHSLVKLTEHDNSSSADIMVHICTAEFIVHVCMYRHTYSKSMYQPGKVANPARGQLNREYECFPVRVRA